MKFIFPSVVVLLSSALLWFSSSALSRSLSSSPVQSPKRSIEKVELSEITERVVADAEENRSDIKKQLTAARSLGVEAQQKGSPQILMKAIAQYERVLDIDPVNDEALLTLANLAFEFGVYDKAQGYLTRYLEKNPDDIKALIDYALVFVRSGQPGEAEKILVSAKEKAPHVFPLRLSLALTYQSLGRTDDARREALAALDIAPDEMAIQVVNDFLAEMESGDKQSKEEGQPAVAGKEERLKQFVENHPILGRKLESITWAKSDEAEVRLRQFPISQMPPFAISKLESSIRSVLGNESGVKQVVLIDTSTADSRLVVDIPLTK